MSSLPEDLDLGLDYSRPNKNVNACAHLVCSRHHTSALKERFSRDASGQRMVESQQQFRGSNGRRFHDHKWRLQLTNQPFTPFLSSVKSTCVGPLPLLLLCLQYVLQVRSLAGEATARLRLPPDCTLSVI
jgi:hypothetical protein